MYCMLMGYGLPLPGQKSIISYGSSDVTIEDKQKNYHKSGFTDDPKNYCIIEQENIKIIVCFFEYDNGRFIVEARNRESAYRVCSIIRAYFTIWVDWDPCVYEGETWIHELISLPEYSWTINDLLAAHDPNIHPNIENMEEFRFKVQQCTFILPHILPRFKYFIGKVLGDQKITNALFHLTYSHRIFNGFMVPSYYSSHYRWDVEKLTEGQRERAYLENRPQYESAFLSAFKAIEYFLGKPGLKENEIEGLVVKCGYPNLVCDPVYRRRFEIYIEKSPTTHTTEIISEFLKMRNATAGHGNHSPPKRLRVSFDSVYEIQNFVAVLIDLAISGCQRDKQ